MNEELVESPNPAQGKGDTADADMQSSFRIGRQVPSFEDNFRETFDLYAEEQAMENRNSYPELSMTLTPPTDGKEQPVF